MHGPHCPQFSGVLVAVSQPLLGSPSQFAKPREQVSTHLPSEQLAVDSGPNGQTMRHAPQLFGSLRVSAQAPSQQVLGGWQSQPEVAPESLPLLDFATLLEDDGVVDCLLPLPLDAWFDRDALDDDEAAPSPVPLVASGLVVPPSGTVPPLPEEHALAPAPASSSAAPTRIRLPMLGSVSAPGDAANDATCDDLRSGGAACPRQGRAGSLSREAARQAGRPRA
jgi:hypothetical protein